jgi:hypothetical protein
MFPQKVLFTLFAVAMVFIGKLSPVMADAPPNSARKSLYDLSEDKVKFVTQRTVLKQEIKQAEDLVPQVRKDEKFIEAQQLRLEKIGREIAARNDLLKQKDQKDTVAIAFQNQYLEKQQALIQESINDANTRLGDNSSKGIQDSLIKKRGELEAAEKGLEETQRSILSTSTPEQDFRKNISAYLRCSLHS